MNEKQLMQLFDVPSGMDEEVLKARAIAELMRMCYIVSCKQNAAGVNIGDLEHALWHIWNMLEEHADTIEKLKDGTYDICRKYKSIAGTAV